jgi:Putative peptidoglycan-binding domain-containing protein
MANMYGGTYYNPYDNKPHEAEEVGVQEKLKLLGYYPGGITGVYDNATKEAVKEFQYENHLPITGIVDDKTMTALYEKTDDGMVELPVNPLSASKPILRQGDKGGAVAELQSELAQLGYPTGAIDGVFGDKTEAAVKKFQTDNKLVADGVVGPKTWSVLDYLYAPIACTQHDPTEAAEYQNYQTDDSNYQPEPEYSTYQPNPDYLENQPSTEYAEHQPKEPFAQSRKPEQKHTNYTVVSGDSLWSISRKNSVSVDAIRTLNGLMSDTLRIGQILKLPQ